MKSNALVTSPRYGREKVDTFINLFKYAQQFYGQKVHDEFSFAMFYSEPPFADLIFQVRMLRMMPSCATTKISTKICQ